MVSISSLTIKGYNETSVPNTFFRQHEEAEYGVIVLPGLGYTAQMPLLFYGVELMASLKADVLTVDYAYNQRDFMALNEKERVHRVFNDVQPAYHALLGQRPYGKLVFMGKSLGTLAMGHILTVEAVPAPAHAVWLTPILRNATLRDQIKKYGGRSLFISGTADPHYDAGYMKEVQKATNGHVMLIDEADHTLNIKGDLNRTIHELGNIIDNIKAFITG